MRKQVYTGKAHLWNDIPDAIWGWVGNRAGYVGYRRGVEKSDRREHSPLMIDELIAFTKQMDRCWMERRFGDLSGYLADDVVVVAPGGKHRIAGLDAAIESYREFMSRSDVDRFDSSGHVVTQRGATAVVEYDWDMSWTDQDASHVAEGREILVLAQRDHGWRVVWRTQLPT
ncbi:MAG: nuclear transport factor 2 family protein [Sphingomonas sp.]